MVAINILPTYFFTQIRLFFLSVSQRKAKLYPEIFPLVILMLPSGWYLFKCALGFVSIFLYVLRSSLVIKSVFIFLRVNSSHKPFDHLNTRSLTVIWPPESTTTGESTIIIIPRILELDDTIKRQYRRYSAAGRQLTVRLLTPRIIVIL